MHLQVEKDRVGGNILSFSPARSHPESMSMSPSSQQDSATPERSQPEIQSTKWPPSPENQTPPSAAADIVAEAKAKISRWSIGHVTDDSSKEEKTSVTAPAKTKFVPKATTKFDSRQVALNKLAAKRIALAKSKAKAGLNFNSKLSSPSKVDEAKASETKVLESKQRTSSSIQISLSNLSNKSNSSGNTAVNEKPTASIAPIMSSTSNQTPETVSTSTSQPAPAGTGVSVSPIVTRIQVSESSIKVVSVSGELPPPSSHMLQAMQATLLPHHQPPAPAATAVIPTSVTHNQHQQQNISTSEVRTSVAAPVLVTTPHTQGKLLL